MSTSYDFCHDSQKTWYMILQSPRYGTLLSIIIIWLGIQYEINTLFEGVNAL